MSRAEIKRERAIKRNRKRESVCKREWEKERSRGKVTKRRWEKEAIQFMINLELFLRPFPNAPIKTIKTDAISFH